MFLGSALIAESLSVVVHAQEALSERTAVPVALHRCTGVIHNGVRVIVHLTADRRAHEMPVASIGCCRVAPCSHCQIARLQALAKHLPVVFITTGSEHNAFGGVRANVIALAAFGNCAYHCVSVLHKLDNGSRETHVDSLSPKHLPYCGSNGPGHFSR